MTLNRSLHWPNCKNIRHLGGYPTADGRQTDPGALVRSDTPAKLTPEGWEALQDYGVRTVITLCTEGLDEPELELPDLPPGIDHIKLAIEDVTDQEFVEKWAATELWSTPLYYHDALRRWPGRHAAVVKTFAQARPGGVLFHCKRGHDRTGIMSLLFLSLAGVSEEDIVADYLLSLDPERDQILFKRNTSSREVILEVLAGLEIEDYLLSGGMTKRQINQARERLLSHR